MEKLKKWGIFFGIVLIISLVIYIFPWRYKIDKTIQGVQSMFIDKGGKPTRQAPLYMIIGECDFCKSWYKEA